jgi:DhnA family fructose-bisphosphate aldolase class Ia
LTSRNRFALEEFFSASLLDQITEFRVHQPAVIEGEAGKRQRRAHLTRDGKLALLAVDHPARGVTKIRNDELAMADRWQFLGRTRRVLEDANLDGVVASTDILEELLILSHVERERSGKSFLDGRVLVGSMNRGGLAGTAFEMEDTFTGISADRLSELHCDGGKMLYRLDPQDAASGRTLTACANAINSLRRNGLAAFVEPLPVTKKTGGYDNLKDAASLARQCGIASALGESSAHVWLKIPYCEDMALVARATTLPILLLGGPARESPMETLRDFANGLAVGPRVRGAIIGRNLLFPGDADPLPMCRALTSLVHDGASLAEAVRWLEEPAAAIAPAKG